VDSFDELYQNYNKDIFRFLYKLCGYDRVLAEDLMQETFLHAYLGITNFKALCSVKTWLMQIAKNRYFLFLRREEKRTPIVSLEILITDLFDEGLNVTDGLYEQQLISDSLDIVFLMSEKMKIVFLDRIYYDMSYIEIAEHLSISVGSAKMLFHRAKLLLQKQLKENYGYEI
jgi:RNA polymerase sigma-70 factor (ECF subfamily)